MARRKVPISTVPGPARRLAIFRWRPDEQTPMDVATVVILLLPLAISLLFL
ncbi:MAG: hypothetical protein IPM18_07125 [Phycisphaerales bacterium]|nr:hypothetical protein [Phycisphaerales bacterium]